MSKSFFTHFSTIFAIHALMLMGTWHLSQSDYVRSQLTKIGTGVLKLQVASTMILAQAPVQKKVKKATPLNPNKPKTTPLKEELVSTSSETLPLGGSEFGTAAMGKTDIFSLYKAELRAMIDKNKSYPAISKRLGQTGTVVVAFTLLEDGHIIDIRIDKPSLYERLNSSALDAVRKVDRFKPIPKEVGETRMVIKVPVKFITL
jgi:TonB family protein